MHQCHSTTSGLSSFSSPPVGWSRAGSWAGSLSPHWRTQKNQHHTPSGCPLSLAQFPQLDPESWWVVWRKQNGKLQWISLGSNCHSVKLQMQHSPLRKVAVGIPVGYPTYEQDAGVVAWTETKVLRTVSERDINPWHTVVDGGEHGKRLIWEEFQETCHSSWMFLLNNVDQLRHKWKGNNSND